MSALQSVIEMTAIQCIPAHCDNPGNEAEDRPAKEGGKPEQEEQKVTFDQPRTIVKQTQKKGWLQQHPDYNISGSF